MEFVVSRNALLQALRHTRCAITKGPLNLFKNFVFTFPDDPKQPTMTVHASNGSIWIAETILLDKTAKPGTMRPFAVWYGDLFRSINSLDEQPLQFTVGEYQLTVRHSCGTFRLPLCNQSEEFLSVPRPCPDMEADDAYSLPYEAPGLRSILSRCVFAMASDELRPTMNGVYVNITDAFTDYVSSDGHQLVRVRKDTVPADSLSGSLMPSFIIPAPVVKMLLRILPVTGDVDIEYQKEKMKEKMIVNAVGQKEKCTEVERKASARIVIDDRITLSFLPVEGRYPKYWSVIPESFNYEMKVDRLPLVKSVNRLALFQPTSGLVKLNITKDSLRLNAEDSDFEMAGEEILPCECSKHDGTAMLTIQMGLKAQRLATVLKSLSSEKIVMRLIDPSRACIILPMPQPDVEEITTLLMPMIIND